MKLLSLSGVALAGLSENGGVAALVVRQKAAAHKGKKSVAALNLKKSRASKKFIDEWHPKMSFVQYKRQDCTNGMHALKVALPCFKAGVRSTLGIDISENFADAATDGVTASTGCPDTSETELIGKFAPKHAILTRVEAGGKTSTQLDMAAEMCSKDKDCGGFVHINQDAQNVGQDGISVKLPDASGNYVGANGSDQAVKTYTNKGAMKGDIVFLASSADCMEKMFKNEFPDQLCVNDAGNPLDNADEICHSACVRASHCKEDQKENTYIKKRIIMSDFGSDTETANTAEEMFEGYATTAAPSGSR